MDALDRHALFQYLLRLGDNSLVLGQRLSECCGGAPMLEEEMALSNMALDLVGQARMLLSLAGQVEGSGRDEDALAMHRDAMDFRNVLLVEQPNGDFANVMLRQFLYASFAERCYAALCKSSESKLAEIAAKSVKECRYHASHSGHWVIRLGDGTAESHRRLVDALELLWPFTGELFEMDEVDAGLVAQGAGADLGPIRADWLEGVGEVLKRAGLQVPAEQGWMQSGGKRGVHSEHLGHLLAVMQFLPRAYPDARW